MPCPLPRAVVTFVLSTRRVDEAVLLRHCAITDRSYLDVRVVSDEDVEWTGLPWRELKRKLKTVAEELYPVELEVLNLIYKKVIVSKNCSLPVLIMAVRVQVVDLFQVLIAATPGSDWRTHMLSDVTELKDDQLSAMNRELIRRAFASVNNGSVASFHSRKADDVLDSVSVNKSLDHAKLKLMTDTKFETGSTNLLLDLCECVAYPQSSSAQPMRLEHFVCLFDYLFAHRPSRPSAVDFVVSKMFRAMARVERPTVEKDLTLSPMHFLLGLCYGDKTTDHGTTHGSARAAFIFHYYAAAVDFMLKREFKALVLDITQAQRNGRASNAQILADWTSNATLYKPCTITVGVLCDWIGKLKLRGTSRLFRLPDSAAVLLNDVHRARSASKPKPDSAIKPEPSTANGKTTDVKILLINLSDDEEEEDTKCGKRPNSSMKTEDFSVASSSTMSPPSKSRKTRPRSPSTIAIATTSRAISPMISFFARTDQSTCTSPTPSTNQRSTQAQTDDASTSVETVVLRYNAKEKLIEQVHRGLSEERRSEVKLAQDMLSCVQYYQNSAILRKPPNGAPCVQNLKKPTRSWLGLSLRPIAEHLSSLCVAVARSLAAEDRCVQLRSPCHALGDIDGKFGKFTKTLAHLWPNFKCAPNMQIVLLGDYGSSLEVIALLLALRLLYPNDVCLLRGNHEMEPRWTSTLQEEFAKSLGAYGSILADKIREVYAVMPLAAVIDGKIFCTHGGIPHPDSYVDESPSIVCAVNMLPPSLPIVDALSLPWQLLKNDASSSITMGDAHFGRDARRPMRLVFDADALNAFCDAQQFTHVLRAQQTTLAANLPPIMNGRLITVSCATEEVSFATVKSGEVTISRLRFG